jgi:hypothetical protein
VHAWTLYDRVPGDLIGIHHEYYPVDRLGKACGHNPDMHANEKSDIVIVPKKAPNNTGLPVAEVAEVLEGRPMAKGNSGKLSAICTQRQGSIERNRQNT